MVRYVRTALPLTFTLVTVAVAAAALGATRHPRRARGVWNPGLYNPSQTRGTTR